LTDPAKDYDWTNYVRDKLWLFGCLGSEPGLAVSQTGGMRRLSDSEVKPPRLVEGSATSATTFRRIPWHLPYNCGKITEKPQSG
jgi:hypothetical protein